MQVDTQNAEIAAALVRIATVLRDAGGFVAEDLRVHERGGDFWCSIGELEREPDRLLVRYPQSWTVPLHDIEWVDDPDALKPVSGMDTLSPVQRDLLEAWLVLINEGRKLAATRQRVPLHAITAPKVRACLAAAGYPLMADPPAPFGERETLLAWHSMSGQQRTGSRARPMEGAGTDSPVRRTLQLIPLKHLANHHPDGADQASQPGTVMLRTAANSTQQQTFENYGDIDAMQQVMLFGYMDGTARAVHSIPVNVDGGPLGTVRVVTRPPRNVQSAALDVPMLRRTDDGVDLRHLTFRPGNRGRIRDLLAMAMASTGVTSGAAHRHADDLLDRIGEANMSWLRGLRQLIGQPEDESAALLAAGCQVTADLLDRYL